MLFKYYNALQNRNGDALAGYLVRLFGSAGEAIDLFSDENGTPISTESGVANAAKSDDLGMVRFYVDSGTYDLRLYDLTDTFISAEIGVPMIVGINELTLAGEDGASLVGTPTGTVQGDIDAANAGLADRPTTTALASPTGGELVGFEQLGDGAVPRTAGEKLRDTVSAADYGFKASNDASENVAAIHAAMKHLLDRFPNDADYYPGGPGDPTDFYAYDRQTGCINLPAGAFYLPASFFSDIDDPRAPFCGFEFVGEGKMSTVLILETGGAEAWFYDNGASDPNKFQQIHWKNIGFRSDDYRYGNGFKIWSAGGPKQFRWTDCDFQYLQKFYQTEGTGNADLIKVTRCTGHFYSDVVTLDNDQSVQHDFIGSDIGTYGHYIRVKQHAGGNVNIVNGSIDFVWHEDYSPAGGNFMFYEDDNATIGQGNCTYAFRDCRVEVEAYKSTAGAPPLGIVRTAAAATSSFPRVLFQNVNFVNGLTYTIDGGGNITSSEFRRITAISMQPRKHVTFEDCVLLKCFFYNVTGSRDTGSPNIGGILRFERCYDGVVGELPSGDSSKENLHARVTYSGSAGRVVTNNMVDHTTGSSFIRKLMDADHNWRKSFAREPSSVKMITNIKHLDNGWPLADNGSLDHYVDLPPDLMAIRIFILKPAVGASTNAYQLHLKITDRAGPTVASSTLAQFKDTHIIDISHVALTGVNRLCICASGTGTDFDGGTGLAYIEHV